MTGQGACRAAARACQAILGRIGAREILARSDLVIMREEFVAIAAENLRLRGEAAEKDECWPPHCCA